MTGEFFKTLAAWAGAAVWAALVIWAGPIWKERPLGTALALALAAACLPAVALGAWLWGWGNGAEGAAAPDRQTLRGTLSNLALAVMVWPFAGLVLGTGTVLAMGLSLGVMRLVAWRGAYGLPLVRSFGAAASLLPTLVAGVWTLVEGMRMLGIR